MTHRVGPKGQVVIPKAIRDSIGIAPGDEVSFTEDGDEVRIRRAADAESARREQIRSLRGIWSGDGSSTEDLVEERRREREREERKARGHAVDRP